MKNFFHLFLTTLFINLSVGSFSFACKKHIEDNENVISTSVNSLTGQLVYICTGSYSYAYHSSSTCPGLNNCKSEIRYVDEYVALNNLSRKPCCRCWSSNSYNCVDDQIVGGGGDDGTVLLMGCIIASAFVVVLSNDFYIYPTYSFYNGSRTSYSDYFKKNGYEDGKGWTFGLRKTFKHSSLEYGLSNVKYGNSTIYDTLTNKLNRWGIHINYVHQLFYNTSPNWIKFYIGPTLNYVYNYGYGGIIGTELKIHNRLRFDLRYELTSQTNQIQAGLIFTYQKTYFWKK